MFACFLCALLILLAREFPAKPETREPDKTIAERTSYCTTTSRHRQYFRKIMQVHFELCGTQDMIFFSICGPLLTCST